MYLGVTLDRTLSYKEHTRKTREKVATRNNLLNKLANSSWGANPQTIRTTALALCYSTAEYCAPVWGRSCHAKTVDPELNNACRKITGTLRPTPLPALYRLAGIAPPEIRREAKTKNHKAKQETNNRHPLYGHGAPRGRLKSRNSFMATESPIPEQPTSNLLDKWKEWDNYNSRAIQSPREGLPSGTDLPRKEWVTLNRARSKVGRTGRNPKRWGPTTSSECKCGNPDQTMEHILRECDGPTCTDLDLEECNEAAKHWIQYWSEKI